MSINIKQNYIKYLNDTNSTKINSRKAFSIGGKLKHSFDEIIIPSLNTIVLFDKLNIYSSKKTGLHGLSNIKIPDNFNWRTDKQKGHLISKPGNQMLCGSCWAISAAGIISDNFVVSNLVDYMPNLSTTYILVNYPQNQCSGGNPSLVFKQIKDASLSGKGITTEHCVDYSWCSTNSLCNGDAKKHMDKTISNEELNDLIPKNNGCYNSNVKHLVFTIDEEPSTLGIGMTDPNSEEKEITEDNWKSMLFNIKKHILLKGPVLGGFLVFKNFMDGKWTKSEQNKGIYLETGDYTNTASIKFDTNQVDSSNFKGSHAVAIIGWGVENDVFIDNNNTKANVPYWYCRNSWTEKWGDDGYFKIAMYPFNKISQFDKQITIQGPSSRNMAGGIVLINVTKQPKEILLDSLNINKEKTLHTERDTSFYAEDSNNISSKISTQNVLKESQTSPKSNHKSHTSSHHKSSSSSIDISNIKYVLYVLYIMYILYICYVFYIKYKNV